MKIGLDIHGVCDANPEFFAELTNLFIEAGHEIHILTGRRVSDGALKEIKVLSPDVAAQVKTEFNKLLLRG